VLPAQGLAQRCRRVSHWPFAIDNHADQATALVPYDDDEDEDDSCSDENGAGDEDNHEDDEASDEEEDLSVHPAAHRVLLTRQDSYVVEKILSHKYERGTLKLQVKWQGYEDPSDLTWETESNLQTAPEAVSEYFDDIGGRPEDPGVKRKPGAGARPGRKRAISCVDLPASTPRSGKRGTLKRKSAPVPEEEEDDEDSATGDYQSLKRLGYPQEHDWDPHIRQVITIEQQVDPKGGKNFKYAKVIWMDERRENKSIPLSIAHKRFPQKVGLFSVFCLC
jgi:chromobox protein 1